MAKRRFQREEQLPEPFRWDVGPDHGQPQDNGEQREHHKRPRDRPEQHPVEPPVPAVVGAEAILTVAAAADPRGDRFGQLPLRADAQCLALTAAAITAESHACPLGVGDRERCRRRGIEQRVQRTQHPASAVAAVRHKAYHGYV